MKQVSFHTFKHIRAMTLREFNLWLQGVEDAAGQAGYDAASRDVIAEIGEEDLYEAILSVKGIGEKRADQIYEAIIERGNQ